MIISNQKLVDRIVRVQNCLHRRKIQFLDWIRRQCKSVNKYVSYRTISGRLLNIVTQYT